MEDDTIRSRIIFDLNLNTQPTLHGGHWWCVVVLEFNGLAGKVETEVNGPPIIFSVGDKPIPSELD